MITKRLTSNLFICLIIMFLHNFLQAQTILVNGKIINSETGENLPGVSVKACGKVQLSEDDGRFSLNISNSCKVLEISYIGFRPLNLSIPKPENPVIDIGNVKMVPAAYQLDEIRIVSAFVTERTSPQPVSTIFGKSIQQKPDNQDFPEQFSRTPGLYVTREGGGNGDNRVTIRGFQQENLAVLLNGVPVSSMENGLVYWSNWTGLADATSAIQVQRGLAASRVAMNSVGGTINIITKTAENQRGGYLKSSVTNFGNLKATLCLRSGNRKNNSSIEFIGSRIIGPGQADATFVNAWSYFLTLSKPIRNNQRIVITAFGAPGTHGQRNYTMSQDEFLQNGVKYNANWGYDHGEMRTLSENFYHKPQVNFNYYRNVNSKELLTVSAYISYGYGGGKYSESHNYGPSIRGYIKNGQIDFDRAYLENENHTDTSLLANGTRIAHFSKNIITNYLSNHYWAGAIATYNWQIGENLKLTAGSHIRNFRSHLFEEVDDLLGGNVWIDQYAWSKAGVAGRNQLKTIGDVINVDNFSMMAYGNLFGQAEYTKGKVKTFVATTLSGTRYQRKDNYNYPDDQLSKQVLRSGFDTKAGISYRIGKFGIIYANAGFYSREPYFKFVYVNFLNDVARGLRNEKISNAEVGYTIENQWVSAKVNLYRTRWKDKSMLSNENIQLANHTTTRALVRGLDAMHSGVEIEVTAKPFAWLNCSANASVGDWKWISDVQASIYDDNQLLVENIKVFANGLKVGDAPQLQFGSSFTCNLPNGMRYGAEWTYFDRLYADFDPTTRTNGTDRMQPYRIPAYGLIDLGCGYQRKLLGRTVVLSLSCINIMNRQVIARGNDGADHTLQTFSGFWTLGRWLETSLRVEF